MYAVNKSSVERAKDLIVGSRFKHKPGEREHPDRDDRDGVATMFVPHPTADVQVQKKRKSEGERTERSR